MDKHRDDIALVEKAQQGDKECLNLLAEAARVRLHQYVQRLTLQEHLTQDIVQESVLEMFKVFDKLKQAERFWDWLDGIAFNKVREHYGRQWRRREVALSNVAHDLAGTTGPDGLADMITAELKEVVVKSMQGLQPRQRAILTLRCYKGMKYAEIAQLMKCSEFGAQALFYRAKKALTKELSRYGFGKGTLLTALAIFGKMTASTEAAAANVTVTAAATKVSLAAALTGALSTKTAVVSLTTAGILAVGGVVATSGPQEPAPVETLHAQLQPTSAVVARPAPPASEASGRYWYYYPQGSRGPVIMQQTKKGHRLWLQDEQANYHHRDHTIYLENHRTWHRSLCVWRLPTDSPQLSEFISRIEGISVQMEPVESDQSHLLVIAQRDTRSTKGISWVTCSNTVLQEDYFQCDWPTGTKTIDNRDAMHQRGWTCFTVQGRLDGQDVTGQGRIPFVYATSSHFSPWMRLDLGGREIIRCDFSGLMRPWMGLHTIDTIRRDAAEQHIPFHTQRINDNQVQVVLTWGGDEITYTVDMHRDVIESMAFSGGTSGWLEFSYLSPEEQGDDFTEPAPSNRLADGDSEGILWLIELVRN